MNDYYVYAHSVPNGAVFYVGKGRGIRQHQTGNRSLYWKRIVKKYGYTSTILIGSLSEEESYSKEVEWIKHCKDLGMCRANFTDGGDGVRVPHRWWNAAISKALTGMTKAKGKENPSFKNMISKQELRTLYIDKGLSSVAIGQQYGLSYTTVIARLRDAGIPIRGAGRVAVEIKCTTDGRVFDSINAAARHYNLFRENIRKVLHGTYHTTGGKHFERSN